jgi:hypothetical protein
MFGSGTDTTDGNFFTDNVFDIVNTAVGRHDNGAVIVGTRETKNRGGIGQFSKNNVFGRAGAERVDFFGFYSLHGGSTVGNRKKLNLITGLFA